MIVPKCDKCGGIEFGEVSIDPRPPTTCVLASGYFEILGKPQISTLELRHHHYKATCKACGKVYAYTMSY